MSLSSGYFLGIPGWDQHLNFELFITIKDYYDSQWDGTSVVICHSDLWGANFLVKPDFCSEGHESFTDCSGKDNVQLGIENSFHFISYYGHFECIKDHQF